jgi:hypothetical protein
MLEIAYAYPTSTHATACGAGESGCFVVLRVCNTRTGELLRSPVLHTRTPFASREAAEAYVKEALSA